MADSSDFYTSDPISQERVAEVGTHLRCGDARGALAVAEAALAAAPRDPDLLLLAAAAALHCDLPQPALRYLKRFGKHYVPDPSVRLLEAVAAAASGRWAAAIQLVRRHRLRTALFGLTLPCADALLPWLRGWVRRIEQRLPQTAAAPAGRRAPKPAAAAPPAVVGSEPPAAARPPLLPTLAARVGVRIELRPLHVLAAPRVGDDELRWFELRYAHAQLALLQEFDELLCLPTLRGVDSYWYQVETARKVLRQLHGRVLLADEVGLGKTVEAGMVVKEYALRGMADRVLVLVPPSLVGQWQEEMATKFDLRFATSQQPLLRRDPRAFWAQPRVIASLATARRTEHLEILRQESWDVVVVDEAHHLKNRSSSNWRLADALRKRFMLLLSATPVENNLIELYNLLTLLKPGIFQTEREFRARYMSPGNPRLPANRERLHDLMRDVMIRNTRALVDVRLPPRRAATLRVEPVAEEAACYAELGVLMQGVFRRGDVRQRLALRHLLAAAGSSPAAAAAAIERFAASAADPTWSALADRYRAVGPGAKEEALLELLARNPGEKAIVFAQHRATLERLAARLAEAGHRFALFTGDLSGAEKDAAIARFRDEVPLLLSSQSGGEGRNLQFCNTLINFDLPWNPMAIEQRIGRLHRIGQRREVFVFNLVVRGTLEEQVLAILDEKIHMFQLVVGEIGAILGELGEEEEEFAAAVFTAWVEASTAERGEALAALGDRLAGAQRRYESVKALDGELFADELGTV